MGGSWRGWVKKAVGVEVGVEKWMRIMISIKLTMSQIMSQMKRKLRTERKMYKAYSKKTVRNKRLLADLCGWI
jgi:hypothetical protein